MSVVLPLQRAEELQLLRQLRRQECRTNHSATAEIADRLYALGECMEWMEGGVICIEITAKGQRAIVEGK